MFCEKCGNQVEDDARFCAQCGNTLEPPAPAGNPAEAGGKKSSGKAPVVIGICAAAAVLVIAAFVIGKFVFGAKDAKGTSMRLRKAEGEVSVNDDEGKSLKVREDLALYSGYDMRTKAESYGWIDLDSVKLVKLDESSRIEIEKDGGDLTIQLKKGNLFFHVTEPLEDDESMEIRTSTLAIGIRGTCGWLDTSEGTRVYLLEGKVKCSAGNKSTVISAGEMAYVDAGGRIAVEQFDVSAIPDFVWDEAEEDDALDEILQEIPEEVEPGRPAAEANKPAAEPILGVPSEGGAEAGAGREEQGVGAGEDAAADKAFVEQYRDIIGKADTYDYKDPYTAKTLGYKYALYQEDGYSVPTLILELNGYDHPAFLLFRYDPDTGTTSQVGNDKVTRFEFPKHSFINDISRNGGWKDITDMSALEAWK